MSKPGRASPSRSSRETYLSEIRYALYSYVCDIDIARALATRPTVTVSTGNAIQRGTCQRNVSILCTLHSIQLFPTSNRRANENAEGVKGGNINASSGRAHTSLRGEESAMRSS
jgi:hypothetical protein